MFQKKKKFLNFLLHLNEVIVDFSLVMPCWMISIVIVMGLFSFAIISIWRVIKCRLMIFPTVLILCMHAFTVNSEQQFDYISNIWFIFDMGIRIHRDTHNEYR